MVICYLVLMYLIYHVIILELMWSFDVYVIMVHIEIDLDKLSIYLSIYLVF